MNHAMFDLETLGTGPDATVVSFGGVIFDESTFEIVEEYYHVFNIQEQLDKGRSVTEGTIRWWLSGTAGALPKQDAAQKKVPNEAALNRIALFLMKGSEIWVNGLSFDCPIIETLFKDYGVKTPYQFWNTRDLRTLTKLMNHQRPKQNSHNALEDAKNQLGWLKECLSQGGE